MRKTDVNNPFAGDKTETRWIDKHDGSYMDPGLTVFSITNGNKNANNNQQSSFHIESPYGEVKPRVVMQSKNPHVWSSLTVTRRNKDGYSNIEQSQFKIVRM